MLKRVSLGKTGAVFGFLYLGLWPLGWGLQQTREEPAVDAEMVLTTEHSAWQVHGNEIAAEMLQQQLPHPQFRTGLAIYYTWWGVAPGLCFGCIRYPVQPITEVSVTVPGLFLRSLSWAITRLAGPPGAAEQMTVHVVALAV